MFYDDDDDAQASYDFTVEDALAALPLPASGIVPPAVIAGFSDLLPDDLTIIKPTWQSLDNAQRITIMERLADSTETDFALDFSTFAHLGYDDPLEAVRIAAIRAGWADESLQTLQKLMYLVQTDRSNEVRAAAMVQIGQYLHLGEVDELDKADTAAAEELTFTVLTDNADDLTVRCRALEAIANTSRPGIPQLIEDAYHSGNNQLRLSAVVAMGNSCNEKWTKYILSELESSQTEMVMEAISAAGTIGIDKAVPKLHQLAFEGDEDIQETAILALGEIGGDDAIDALQELAEFAEDEDNEELMELVEDSLAAAEMVTHFFMDGDNYDEDEDDLED